MTGAKSASRFWFDEVWNDLRESYRESCRHFFFFAADSLCLSFSLCLCVSLPLSLSLSLFSLCEIRPAWMHVFALLVHLRLSAGFLIMLPVAVCFGEVFTFENSGIQGFLDRPDLHSPMYLLVNLFAGEPAENTESKQFRRARMLMPH